MDTPTLSLILAAAPEPLHLPVAMLLVFGCAKLLAELFERCRQPGIVGEIMAGVLLGPSVLDWVRPGETLETLAHIGVMFLLFRVGLEVQPSELLGLSKTAGLVAASGVIIPFAFGGALAWLWGEPTTSSIFVGACMVATSVGITAQVLAAKGVLDQRASKIILAAAVIDDVLGLLVLAAVSGVARGKVNYLDIGITAALAIVFVVLVSVWGSKAVGRLVPAVQNRLRLGESEFAIAMVLLFAFSAIAERAGVAAIVGAFLAGMALAETAGARVRDLAHGTTELLVPFFLAGIGLQVNLGAFRSGTVVMFTLVLLLAAVVSKMIGCGLAALPMGKSDALKIGVGMIPRGEVGMVAAQMGLSVGAISSGLFGVIVFVAAATTLVAPPLLNVVFRREAETVEEEPVAVG